MAAQAVYLPDGIKVGLVARYLDDSVIQTGDTQRERRIKVAPLARRGWTAQWVVGSVPTVERMFEVFGTHTSFLLKPPRAEDYTETDQPVQNTVTGLTVGDGSTALFQLQITRTLGNISGSKLVMHPRSATAVIKVDGATQILATDYTIAYTTGVVTFISIPAAGKAVTASFLYDTPVRFLSTSVETNIQQAASGDGRIEEVNSTALIEVFDE